MQIELPSPELRLLPDQPLRLRRGRGLVVACKSGIVWITVAGRIEDIFLSAGERYVVESNALTLIEAVEPAAISIQPISRSPRLRLGISVKESWLPKTCPT
jgi:hypothetical protein